MKIQVTFSESEQQDILIKPAHIHRVGLYVAASALDIPDIIELFGYTTEHRKHHLQILQHLEKSILAGTDGPLTISQSKDVFCGPCPLYSTCAGHLSENDEIAKLYALKYQELTFARLKKTLSEYHVKSLSALAQCNGLPFGRNSHHDSAISAGNIHRLDMFLAGGRQADVLLHPHIYHDLAYLAIAIAYGDCGNINIIKNTKYDSVVAQLYGVEKSQLTFAELLTKMKAFHQRNADLFY